MIFSSTLMTIVSLLNKKIMLRNHPSTSNPPPKHPQVIGPRARSLGTGTPRLPLKASDKAESESPARKQHHGLCRRERWMDLLQFFKAESNKFCVRKNILKPFWRLIEISIWWHWSGIFFVAWLNGSAGRHDTFCRLLFDILGYFTTTWYPCFPLISVVLPFHSLPSFSLIFYVNPLAVSKVAARAAFVWWWLCYARVAEWHSFQADGRDVQLGLGQFAFQCDITEECPSCIRMVCDSVTVLSLFRCI